MYSFLICILCLAASSCFSASGKGFESVRSAYANNFYRAFELQCSGRSTSAYTQFRVAYEQAEKAGENLQNLALMQQLFGWYRMYGTSCHLFAQAPTGWDVIAGEYKNPYISNGYSSEWGKTPEQAALVRTFMLGVGELISGVFCVAIGSVAAGNLGLGLISAGFCHMYSSANDLWAMHERALLDLKKCEDAANKIKR